MINFKVGDILIGTRSKCKLQVLDIYQFERIDGSKEMKTRLKDMDSKDIFESSLSLIQNSAFEVVKGGK